MGIQNGNSPNIKDSVDDVPTNEKWWDTDNLDDYDRETEDWLEIVNRLSPVRTDNAQLPTREQLRFWYLQLQPKQRWAYSIYRETVERTDQPDTAT